MSHNSILDSVSVRVEAGRAPSDEKSSYLPGAAVASEEMPGKSNPAIRAFLDAFPREILLGQILVRRQHDHFIVCHAEDCAITESLRKVQFDELLTLVQTTAEGTFRPLKSAPDLRRGWIYQATSVDDLDVALNRIYPGAIADWYAVHQTKAVPAHYRDFSNRQTGMYRITQKLTDGEVATVIKAACDRRFCLKRRLWTVEGFDPDKESEKSLIPCLEPCALLMELARKAMRIEQEEKVSLEFSQSEAETLLEILRQLTAQKKASIREADLNSALNPRRIKLLLEKLQPQLIFKNDTETE